MKKDSQKIIFHIDVNSAFLSWTALDLIKNHNMKIDIRLIPSIVGGNSEDRKGVVLAKSIPAKKFNIITGEPIVSAMKKCPNLKVFNPNHKLYIQCSNSMYKLLQPYSSSIERYSIDEVFMDMTHFNIDYMEKAGEIKSRIENELGFTVNIGIGNNKILAKMASDFPKKNSIHTLYKEEIKEKMWPLEVGRLFMVGSSAEKKLLELNIKTIGDLANYNINILRNIFKSYANIIYEYANGIDESIVGSGNNIDIKGIGNSSTTRKDITNKREALKLLLELTESVAKRLRENNNLCSMVAVSIKSNKFVTYSHQKTLFMPTDSTTEIYKHVTKVFEEVWKNEPVRQLGIRVGKLTDNTIYQKSIFDEKENEKSHNLDKTIDQLRKKYGENIIVRSTFVNDREINDNENIEKSYLKMGGFYSNNKNEK